VKIVLGADHAGCALKNAAKEYLLKRDIDVIDLGVGSDDEPVDYSDIGIKAAEMVAAGESDRGILSCGTGIGMSIAANKVRGAYAALCTDSFMAKMSRLHNNANILVLGGRVVSVERAMEMVGVWLDTPFEGGRHFRRIEKIRAYENKDIEGNGSHSKGRLVIMDHPLIQHKLGIIRNTSTSVKEFRELVEEIAGLMVYEITRDLPVEEIEVETPLAKTRAKTISGKKMAVVPVLRAGLGMVQGILKLIPNAKVGHIGVYRDPTTLQPVEYYCKLPGDIEERDILIVDPMLATGGSSVLAIDLVKRRGGKKVSLVCLIGAPEGLQKVKEAHPDVDIYMAALDDHLDEHGYIVPGLGDAGDRLFGTK
jgi:uracil phosphoribosyltransferase